MLLKVTLHLAQTVPTLELFERVLVRAGRLELRVDAATLTQEQVEHIKAHKYEIELLPPQPVLS